MSEKKVMWKDVHFGDVLQSYGNGVQLDLRVRLAVDFLKVLMMPTQQGRAEDIPDDRARKLAEFAVDISTELLNVAAERGLIKHLPDTDELPGAMRMHLRRAVRANIFQQVSGQEIAQEEGPRIDARRLVGDPGGRKS